MKPRTVTKATADPLCPESQLHLIDTYLARGPPRHIETIYLAIQATEEVPVDLFGGAWSTVSLAPKSSVAFFIHGRDGLSVSKDVRVTYEQRYGHLQTTIIVFETMERMASEGQTGWVEATPGRLMRMFNTERLVKTIREEESDIVYRRLVNKWSAQ